MHGWRFNLENGSCETRPERPSRTYLTRVEDGAIQVQLRPPAPKLPPQTFDCA
jgi:nitrite reductase/ring-hydroxylating ferredoxin subunit